MTFLAFYDILRKINFTVYLIKMHLCQKVGDTMKILSNIVKNPKQTSDVIKSFLIKNKNLFEKLSEFIIINKIDNGKKQFILYNKKEDNLLFSYFSYKYYNKFTMDKIDKCNIHKVKYDSEIELEDELLRYSILSKAINNDNIFIIHEYFGWQQVFNSYVYRDLSSITNKLQSYELENGDCCFEFNKDINTDYLLRDYNELIKTINLLPHDFTLPLLAYNIFSYTKSLYKQYRHKFDISKTDNYFALNVIPTHDANTNNFLIKFVKEFSLFTIKEKIFNPKRYESEIGTLNKPVCSDFPVFIYNSKIQNLEAKTTIPSSIFHKAVTSNISYIYYNIKNFEDHLITLSVPKNIELSSLDKNIQVKFPQTLFDDYLDFISKTLSYETYEKEKTRKEKLINKIYDEDYEGHIIPYIYDFINDICRILQNKKISKSKAFLIFLLSETEKFTMKEFEALEKEYSDENRMIIHNFAKRYYDKHLLECEHQFANKNTRANLERYVDMIAKTMTERYVEMLVNSYISTSSHHPTYFDNLHKKAEKYLKDNLKGKKYDHVQASHCSFLLAAMFSFKDYIDNRLPEVSDDFNKYFQAFNNIVLQMCCTPLDENIDNATTLSDFAAFLKLQIESGFIIDRNSEIDSDIGWIDRKENKIFIKNSKDGKFYDKFKQYLIDRNKHFDLSKQAFVRDVLAENGVINARTSSKKTKVQRYDSERKILKDRPKFRVLVLNCDSLNIK